MAVPLPEAAEPLAVGVDLGGTKIRAGLGAARGAVLAELEVPTRDHGAHAPEQIRSLVERLCDAHGVPFDAVRAVGVGGAGVAPAGAGALSLAPNLGGLAGRDLAAELRVTLGIPVAMDNDVNLAALGELSGGSAGRDFCFVALGTGVGMGVVVDGRLVRGHRGAAGEIGYLPLGGDPLDPVVQRHGAFEEVVGGVAAAREYERRTGRRLTTPEVFDLRAAGDPDAAAAVDDLARWVALGLAAVVAVLDPALVVLGGGVGRRPDLRDDVEVWLRRLGHAVPVQVTALGPSGPVRGGIQLALDHVQQRGRR